MLRSVLRKFQRPRLSRENYTRAGEIANRAEHDTFVTFDQRAGNEGDPELKYVSEQRTIELVNVVIRTCVRARVCARAHVCRYGGAKEASQSESVPRAR